jgi:hypothetical protein
MRSFAAAAIIGLAAAVPQYGYGGYPAESSSTPEAYYPSSTAEEYPTYPSSSSAAGYYPASSSAAGYYPASSSVEVYPSSSTPCPESSTAAPVYPTVYPSGYVTKTIYSTSVHTVTSCAEYVTDCPAHSTIMYTTLIPVTTTVCPESETPVYTPYPSSTAKGYHSYPAETSAPCSSTSTVTVTIPYSSGAPYYPVGTGAPHYPPVVGTASSSGYMKPSAYPPAFTGAASHAKVGGFVAGVGAFAALFL